MPSWIWPQRLRDETNVLIRLGRVLHWLATGIGLLPIAFLAYGSLAWGPPPGPGEYVPLIGIGAIFLILGRGLRYILSNE